MLNVTCNRQPAHFDLVYNGLGEQDEEIRLTIGKSMHIRLAIQLYHIHTDTTQNSETIMHLSKFCPTYPHAGKRGV